MLTRSAGLVVLLLLNQPVLAHGGVGMVEGQCIIQMGNLESRFTGYQPASRGSKEFCDDLPDLSNSIFVLDFIHDVLKNMTLDFRIIRDEKSFGLTATADDIETINDLELVTEYYKPPIQYGDGMVKFQYEFSKAGVYIGIITAQHPNQDIVYEAVFPFRVGAVSYADYWPVFILVLVVLQLMYWRSNSKVSAAAIKP